MRTRSAPPSWAHLADSPVPAPAPITGATAAIWARSAASGSARVIAAPGRARAGGRPWAERAPAGGHGHRERRVVDVGVDLVSLDLRRVDAVAQRREQRLVGVGVAER